MISMKKIIRYAAIYLLCVAAIGAGIYFSIVVYGQKTFHLDRQQWRPAEPETQHIDLARLNRALEYIDTRLPTARSLLLLRNGRTVVEKYYWLGGPGKAEYLHSLNLPLLQALIGIAVDQQLIQGPEQPLSDFFRNHLPQTPGDGAASLTLGHLLKTRAPVLWGAGSPDYWDLFYAGDPIEASLRLISRPQAGSGSAINFAAAYLLSRVIEQASGQSVYKFADQYLFQPLGITTYAEADDDLLLDPTVGFQLKTLDLAKFGYLLAREGVWEDRRIVSGQWVRRSFLQAPSAEFDDAPGGSWVKTKIRGHESLVARGEGGQYLVLVPALQVVVVATSTSRFALPRDNGHDRLLQLVMEAVLEAPDTAKTAALNPGTGPAQQTDRISPNFVFSTPVQQDILDFFDDFAQDVVSKDIHRIAENYARGYDHSRDTFASPSRLMFGGGGSPPHLEYVHITRIRIEKNRAYLRGKLKFAFRSYAGSQGEFPLENLIKLKGQWRWLGLPEKTALLDRDEYFDAELSAEHQRFVDGCSGPLIGESRFFGNDCFAETIQPSGGGQKPVAERLQPFLRGRSGVKLHVTGIKPNGAGYRVYGYIEGSALGELRLPDDLHMVKENGGWKWQRIVDSKQTE